MENAVSEWELRLRELEPLLAAPRGPQDLDEAVAVLREACHDWPLMMGCLTDRSAWAGVASQIRRLEELTGAGVQMAEAWQEGAERMRPYTAAGTRAAVTSGASRLIVEG